MSSSRLQQNRALPQEKALSNVRQGREVFFGQMRGKELVAFVTGEVGEDEVSWVGQEVVGVEEGFVDLEGVDYSGAPGCINEAPFSLDEDWY